MERREPTTPGWPRFGLHTCRCFCLQTPSFQHWFSCRFQMPPWSSLDIPDTCYLWPFYLLFLLPGMLFWPQHSMLTQISTKCLLTCLATPPKIDSFPTLYLFFSPSFFLGNSSPYGIWSIFSFIWLIIFPPTRMFTPRRAEISPFLFTVVFPVPKYGLALRRCSTDVLSKWIKSHLTSRISFLLDGVVLPFLS